MYLRTKRSNLNSKMSQLASYKWTGPVTVLALVILFDARLAYNASLLLVQQIVVLVAY